MNWRAEELVEARIRGVVALCFLLLCGSGSFAAKPDWPQRYNAGVIAYQSNDFARAAAGFENATASADQALQQRALYNLGNTDYRLGQTQPSQAQQLWQRALKHYESALALNPQDADAKFNQEFVKKKLEELKKQQEQQQQNQKNQQDKKQEQNKDEQKDQEKKQDQQQNSKANQSKQQEQQQSQQSQEQKQAQEQKDQQQAQQQKSDQPEQKPPEKPGEPGNYDKMQATALLNDLRENEQNWNFFPEVQMKDLKDSGEPSKDW
jgi:Ca-activated chloride channel family protein